MDVKKILIISGATATGKTSLSLDIAQQGHCEIVNFDSLLFYKELNIGTAKPSQEEMNKIPHHLINITSIKKPLNAADYCRQVIPIIDHIHQKNKTPILVGGSGFYLKALINGMFPTPTPSAAIIEKSERMYQDFGIGPFIDLLKKYDPPSFKKLHPNDHYRIRRAMEFFWTAGYPISEAPHRQAQYTPRFKEKNWLLHHCYLHVEKEKHYSIIKSRTEKMIKAGLIEEVKNLLEKNYTGEEKPLKSIGYKETIDFLKGKFSTHEELIQAIFISTRQLAKAQRTWFNSVENKNTYQILSEKELAIQEALQFLFKNQ